MEDVGEERREIDLPRRQALDDAHGRTAAGTWPRSRRFRWRGRWRWIGRAGQGAATLWELHRATARGEEAEVADAHEPSGQILTGPLCNEPMWVETVQANGPAS